MEKYDEEPALLTVEACELSHSIRERLVEVMLNEEGLKPKHMIKARYDNQWYLDSGASNHMTGSKEMFSHLDAEVTGIVRFGDGSSVDICGCGTVLIQC